VNPAFNPPVGTLPTLEWIGVQQLSVDDFYQRSIENEASKSLIRKIARFWNWDLCQPLAVSRRDTGELYVVDGQHRWTAAKMRGDIAHLPCVVQRHREVGDEAALFVALNKQRQKLTAADLFKAALAAGDEEATAIAEAMEAAGLKLASHPNYNSWKPGMVANISGIQAAWRKAGRTATKRAMKSLTTAFAGQVLQYAGTLFGGIALFHAQRLDGPPYGDAFHAMLGGASQAEWKRLVDIERAAGGKRWDQSAHAVLERAFVVPPVLPPAPAPSAPAPMPAAKKRVMTFAEQLEAVRNGARVETKLDLRKPAPDMTLGGVGTAQL